MLNKYQEGASLFISLIMLLMLTMLGITLMKGSILQEKMSGNSQSKNISFQDAEAALRVSESIALATTVDEAYGFNGADGKYLPNASAPIWENASTTWQEATTGQVNKGGSEQPEYLLEFFDMVPREPNCAININDIQKNCFVPMYRATGKGYGLNAKIQSVVQTTFKVLQ